MVELDFAGLLLSWFLLGPRYPVLVTLVILFAQVVEVLLAWLLGLQLQQITVGGVFGTIFLADHPGRVMALPVIYSGPVFCYFLSRVRGGLSREEGTFSLNPLAEAANPLGVVAWRFFLFSSLFVTWSLFNW